MYLFRASGYSMNKRWSFFEVNADWMWSENPVKQLVKHIIDSFKNRTGLERCLVEEKLKDPGNGTSVRVFLLFPMPEPDKSVLSDLRSELPAVTFFVLSGDYVPPSTVSEISGARFLTPALEPEDVQQLDSIDHIDQLQEVGQAVAAQKVKPRHFAGFIS